MFNNNSSANASQRNKADAQISHQNDQPSVQQLNSNEDSIARILNPPPLMRSFHVNREISDEYKLSRKKEFLQEKRSQQLRANNLELRELERKLKAAKYSKELTEQIRALKEYKNQEEETAKENSMLDKLFEEKTNEIFDKMIQDKSRLITEYRKQLDEQMTLIKLKRKKEIHQLLIDKEDMEKYLKKLDDRLLVEYEKYAQRKKEAQLELMECLREQEAKKHQAQVEKLIDENAKILEMLSQRDKIKQQLELDALRVIEKRQNISDNLGQHLLQIELDRIQREQLFTELLGRERLAREQHELRMSLERQQKKKKEYINDLNSCRNDLILKAAQDKEEEERFNAQQKEICDEIEIKKSMDKENLRKKTLKEMYDIQKTLENRRKERAAEKAENVVEFKLNVEKERIEQIEVEKERLRILLQQPNDVVDIYERRLTSTQVPEKYGQLVDIDEKMKKMTI